MGERKKGGEAGAGRRAPRKSEDGRYVVIDGRRWRATDPSLPEETRLLLVSELMEARREVGRALRACDAEAEAEARRRVHAAKVALGERGPKWWEGEKGGKGDG
jgi:hypothetical protein